MKNTFDFCFFFFLRNLLVYKISFFFLRIADCLLRSHVFRQHRHSGKFVVNPFPIYCAASRRPFRLCDVAQNWLRCTQECNTHLLEQRNVRTVLGTWINALCMVICNGRLTIHFALGCLWLTFSVENGEEEEPHQPEPEQKEPQEWYQATQDSQVPKPKRST